jgi:hypothetical protein
MINDRPHVEFQITTVGGERGERLAALQAEAILDVLQWLSDHHRAARPENSDAVRPNPRGRLRTGRSDDL